MARERNLHRRYGHTVSESDLASVRARPFGPRPSSGPIASSLTVATSLSQGVKWALTTQHVVHQAAFQGRRNTGGTWTRPDFVVIGYRKFEYTPGIVRDVETFEVKPSTCGIEAVFETAAHSRVATKSFLAIHVTDDGPTAEDLDRIEAECVRFGLGLILFSDPKAYDEWQYRVEPNRTEPDPFSLEEFIQTQIPPADQEKIRKWLR